MSLKNDIKAGYQGQYDSMRALADKLLNTSGKKYKEGGLVMESRQAMDNNMYAKDKKAAEKYQEREHKDYAMMRNRENKDYEKRKKFAEAKEHMEHERYEEMKKSDPERAKILLERIQGVPLGVKYKEIKKSDPERGKILPERVKNLLEGMEGPAFKKGGKVTSKCASKVQKFAAGGVAKIRHDVATTKGAPKNQSKGNLRSVYY